MIIGNGLIGKALFRIDNNDCLFFASGVSNSLETRVSEYLREKNLLIKYLKTRKFLIYFSSCSIFDKSLVNTPYVNHKKEMEFLVTSCNKYLIIRLPQVVGHTYNPHTLTNYLYNKICNQETFEIWNNAKRNLIDVDHVVDVTEYMVNNIDSNVVKTIANTNLVNVIEIVKQFELIIGKKANYNLINKGNDFLLSNTLNPLIYQKLKIEFNSDYLGKLLIKYYKNRQHTF